MRHCKKNQIDDCKSCIIAKRCIVSRILQEDIEHNFLDIVSEVYHAYETIPLDNIIEENVAIVRTGAIISNYKNFNKEITLCDLYFPGDIIGFLPKVDDYSTIELNSIETSSLCFFKKDLLESHEKIYIDCLKKILAYFSENNLYKKKLLFQRNPEKRVAMFLLTIIEKKNLNSFDNIQFKINLTRMQMGLYLGIAEETVVRALRYLCLLELLEVKGKNFIIPQYKKLSAFYRCD